MSTSPGLTITSSPAQAAPSPKPEYLLRLPPGAIQVIVKALVGRPYGEVAGIIGIIEAQIREQDAPEEREGEKDAKP